MAIPVVTMEPQKHTCPACRQATDRLTMSGVCDRCADEQRADAFDEYLNTFGARFDPYDEADQVDETADDRHYTRTDGWVR